MEACTASGSLLWCGRKGRLLWADALVPALWAHAPASGRTRSWPMPEPVRAIALTGSDDRLLLGLASQLAFFSFSTGRLQYLHALDSGTPMRDGCCDRQGRFVFGLSGQGLFRLNLDLALERLPLGHGLSARGICFSPDGRRLYFGDAATGDLLCAASNPCSGEVGAARIFVRAAAVPGEAVGATVDAEGHVWSARRGAGQLARFTPDGQVERVIEIETRQPACVAFGGPDVATLYLTVAGQGGAPPIQLEAGVRGLPEPRFLHA